MAVVARFLLVVAASGLPAPLYAQQNEISPYSESTIVDDAALSVIAGREDILNQTNLAKNYSTVRNNSVTGNSVTGTINFSDTAFQNLSGFSILNANTGNNVSINAALQVNLSINTP